MQKMATEGLPRLATKRGPMPPFKPIRIKGASITKTISEERDEK